MALDSLLKVLRDRWYEAIQTGYGEDGTLGMLQDEWMAEFNLTWEQRNELFSHRG